MRIILIVVQAGFSRNTFCCAGREGRRLNAYAFHAVSASICLQLLFARVTPTMWRQAAVPVTHLSHVLSEGFSLRSERELSGWCSFQAAAAERDKCESEELSFLH